jgi:hypothetical protein
MEWLKSYLAGNLLPLSGRAKREYIWQYYKLWIIGAAALAVFLVFACYRFFFVPRENWFFAVITNTYAEVGEGSELWRGYVDFSGYDTTKKKVVFNNNVFFDPTRQEGFVGNSYYESFVAFADSGDLDVVVMEKPQLEALGASGWLLDWNREECDRLREQYGDRLIYTQPYDEEYSTEPVPIGIDVSDSILMTRFHIYAGESCAVGINAKSQHPEAVEQFLHYIFEEESHERADAELSGQ